jgi:hypothetical protein
LPVASSTLKLSAFTIPALKLSGCIMFWIFVSQVQPSTPSILYTDSEGALAHTQDHKVVTPRNKHWAPKYHYVRELKENGIITYKHIPGSQNPADFLTKSVSKTKLISSTPNHSNRVKVQASPPAFLSF